METKYLLVIELHDGKELRNSIKYHVLSEVIQEIETQGGILINKKWYFKHSIKCVSIQKVSK